MKSKTKNVSVTVQKIKKQEKIFVGIDLHKIFLQVAVVNDNGELLRTRRVDNDKNSIKDEFSEYPKDAKYFIESSSVWYGVYGFLTDSLNLYVVLSNPYQTRLIAESKKKTDKVDAKILAEMLRGGYIAICYVPNAEIIDNRLLARHRAKLVRKVEWHNNSAERGIRPCAILRNNSYGSRSEGGAASIAVLMSVKQTYKAKKDNFLDVMHAQLIKTCQKTI